MPSASFVDLIPSESHSHLMITAPKRSIPPTSSLTVAFLVRGTSYSIETPVTKPVETHIVEPERVDESSQSQAYSRANVVYGMHNVELEV